MDILAPVSRPEEVEPLARAGATDLYCGVYDERWARRWGLGAWPNRRGPGPGNLASPAELAEVSAEARLNGLRLHLTINSPVMGPEQERAVVAFARRACEAHVHGLIVANPALLPLMPDVRLTASTLSGTHNAEGVRFLAELGAGRVILSRQLSLAEILAIRRAVRVELEVFILNDACVFEESSCHTAHTAPAWGGPYCLARRRCDDLDFASALAARQPWLEALGDRSLSSTGLPVGPCGLCALVDLVESGVQGVKIVGREAHPYRKVRSTQMVRHVLDGISQGNGSEARERAVALQDRQRCRSGLYCYYPEARPDLD